MQNDTELNHELPRSAAELLQLYADSKHNEVLTRIDALRAGQEKQKESIEILTRAVVGENLSGNVGLLAKYDNLQTRVTKLETYVIMGYGGFGVIGIAWAMLKGFKIIN